MIIKFEIRSIFIKLCAWEVFVYSLAQKKLQGVVHSILNKWVLFIPCGGESNLLSLKAFHQTYENLAIEEYRPTW